MHFHFKSIRISFVSKITRVDRATIVASDTCLCGVILVLLLEFHPGHRAEISHMNTQQKFIPVTEPGRLTGSYEEALRGSDGKNIASWE